VESPRRAEARRDAEQRRGAASTPPSRPIEPDKSASGGLEELAKAGAGLAFDAAGIGLRLAGRAAGQAAGRIGRLTGRD
jgi:hypothetical protein